MKYWVLDKIFNKPSSPRQMEYLAVDKNFQIVDSSDGVKRFADAPQEVFIGQDIRLSFPELYGVEDTLLKVMEGLQDIFEFKGIARSLGGESSPLYIDIYCLGDQEQTNQNRLIVVIEDTTERMVLEQTLVQRVNEANLLSSALATSRDYIDKIITSMADALLVTSISGKIKRINPAAMKLFGYSEEELNEQHISKIITDKNFSFEVNQKHLLSTKEVIKNIDLTCQTKDDKQLTVGFSCSAINSKIEELQEFVYVGRDITDRKRSEEEMRQALVKEKELNELKSRFVSMVSHEFGNPLNRILMAVELLQQYSSELTEPEKIDYLNHIQIATQQMTQLLKDVLIIGRAEAGKIEFNPMPLELDNFCEDLVKQIKIGTGGKRIINFINTGLIASEEEARELPLMDEKLLRHILTNLLSNAIKYSSEESEVDFQLSYQEGQAIFQIKDRGIGIPPEDLEKLFETFHRARNVGKISGTGLGLAIVKQSVDLHQGTIMVESKVGEGTIFIVTIPLHSYS